MQYELKQAAEAPSVPAREGANLVPSNDPSDSAGVDDANVSLEDSVNGSEDTMESLRKQIADLEAYKSEAQASNQKLIDLFKENPEIPDFLQMMIDGASFAEAIARNIDLDAMTPIEGDPNHKEWENAKKERKRIVLEKQKKLDAISENIKVSQGAFKSFAESKKLSEEQIGDMAEHLQVVINDMIDGKVGEDVLDTVYKAMNFDALVEAAREEAVLETSNKKIEEFQENDSTRDAGGDGLPHVDTVRPVDPSGPKEMSGLEDVLDLQAKRGKF